MKHLAEVAHKVAQMSEIERAELSARINITTVEGHALSIRNQIIASMQSSGPVTIVGGFRQWLTHGRCVRKGERAMYILHPCMRKADDGTESSTFFREAPIFDVSQTDILEVAA